MWFIHAANRVIDYAYFHADLDDIDMILTSLTNTTMEILTRSLREAPEDVSLSMKYALNEEFWGEI